MLGHCFEVENKLIKAVHIETVKRKNEKKKKGNHEMGIKYINSIY